MRVRCLCGKMIRAEDFDRHLLKHPQPPKQPARPHVAAKGSAEDRLLSAIFGDRVRGSLGLRVRQP